MTVRQRHAPLTTKRRTYSHLEGLRKVPDEYDLATTKLLYYVERGFAVNGPAAAWYEAHQKHACLTHADWDAFVDPRRTTYAKYVSIARGREAQADGIVNAMEQPGHDERLSPGWLDAIGRFIGPLRHALHGLQMTASYVGSMAPAGRVVIVHLFQSADEMRRIQRLTQRLAQLGKRDPGTLSGAKDAWLRDGAWQPLRELVEKLLVRYDWAEAFLALNVCVKPVVDRLVTNGIGARAIASGDPLLGALVRNLGDDAEWHRAFSRALVTHALAGAEGNRDVVVRITGEWLPRALAAAAPLGFVLGESAPEAMAALKEDMERDVRSLLAAPGAAP
jgi:toluene monooxygenase system protein E